MIVTIIRSDRFIASFFPYDRIFLPLTRAVTFPRCLVSKVETHRPNFLTSLLIAGTCYEDMSRCLSVVKYHTYLSLSLTRRKAVVAIPTLELIVCLSASIQCPGSVVNPLYDRSLDMPGK